MVCAGGGGEWGDIGYIELFDDATGCLCECAQLAGANNFENVRCRACVFLLYNVGIHIH